MFKAKSKCMSCEHMADGIYFQKNECYNRIKQQINKAIEAAKETKDYELYSWLNETYVRLRTFEQHYARRMNYE